MKSMTILVDCLRVVLRASRPTVLRENQRVTFGSNPNEMSFVVRKADTAAAHDDFDPSVSLGALSLVLNSNSRLLLSGPDGTPLESHQEGSLCLSLPPKAVRTASSQTDSPPVSQSPLQRRAAPDQFKLSKHYLCVSDGGQSRFEMIVSKGAMGEHMVTVRGAAASRGFARASP